MSNYQAGRGFSRGVEMLDNCEGHTLGDWMAILLEASMCQLGLDNKWISPVFGFVHRITWAFGSDEVKTNLVYRGKDFISEDMEFIADNLKVPTVE